MLTLKESLERQYDHYLRCKALAASGVILNSKENEDKSYNTLYNKIPNITPETKVLDLGCGGGGAAYYRLFKDTDYYGLEAIKEVGERAIASGLPNITIGFMEKMDKIYKPNFFDVVWTRHVLEHSININKVLQNIKKVMKTDGVLAFIVPCGFHNEPAHISEFDKDGWVDVIQNNGFYIETDWQHDFNLNEYCGIARICE